MKDKKRFIYKMIFVAGVVLMLIYAFLPLIKITDGSEFGIEGENLKLGVVSMTFIGSALSVFGEAFGELGITAGILKLLMLVMYWIPFVITLAGLILSFVGKMSKTVMGMTIVNSIYFLIFNLGLHKAMKSIIKLADAVSYDEASEYVNIPVIPVILLIISILLCVAAAILLSRGGSQSKAKAVGGANIKCIAGAGDMSGARVGLPDNESIIIGRDPAEASFVVFDSKVSRKHCAVEFSKAENRAYVTDLSSNGTRLGDGTRLTKGLRTPVADGTVIVLSPASKFVIELPAK